MAESIIQKRAFLFAVRIVRLSQYLQKRREYVISKQIMRSGTSIGANIEEALGACSKRDFIAKMTIVNKEIRETNYWLKLLSHTGMIPIEQIEPLQKEGEELLKMGNSIVITSRKKLEIKS